MTKGRTGRARVLVVDSFDSFTFTLVDYLRTAGAVVDVVRNNALTVEQAMARDDDAVLLSPGPGTPAEAGICIDLARACVEARRPLLGVCLGHQAIGEAFGAQTERLVPIHGKVAAIDHDSTGLFEGLPSPFAATRYHSLGLRGVPRPLIANATSPDGIVMGLRHWAAPVHGVQFHPESVASEHGHALIRAFVGLVHQDA